ncbi:MAG TPA: hypothetical protein VNO82_09815 [Solirubrobacteraceae bacterium]|nr:hypothetical protein [Solirubrobacteraceae bacterium]
MHATDSRQDLEPALEGVVDRGKRALGLPPSYRLRHPRSVDDDELADKLATVLDSRSWRLTRPLRAAARWMRRLR